MRRCSLIISVLILFSIVTTDRIENCCIGIRGNVDSDQFDIIDIADLVFLVDYMFNDGTEPVCFEEADVDGENMAIDIADLVYLVSYMFTGGLEPPSCPIVYLFEFQQDNQGWTHGFADYPFDAEIFYELDFQWLPLPNPLDTNQNSLFITGNNHSDDLFMFIKKHITGLSSNSFYDVTFDIQFASKYPTNAIGVGGAPGEGVTMKAGATLFEPDRIDGTEQLGYPGWIMNLDKGNQVTGGEDMYVIGHVGVTDTTTVYALKSNNNFTNPFTVMADTSGAVWVCIGTDSGFESTTALYYNRIEITFSPTE